jgi:hypothetical protein
MEFTHFNENGRAHYLEIANLDSSLLKKDREMK